MTSTAETEFNLPSDRASWDKQKLIFDSVVRLSGDALWAVKTVDVARTTGLGQGTVAEVLRWGSSIALVEQSERGAYRATAAGRDISLMWKVDPAQARLMLHHVMRGHWSFSAALSALGDAPVPQQTLARRLQGSLPGKSRRGLYLVDWLVMALIVHRGSDQLVHPARLPEAATAQGPRPAQEPKAVMNMTNEQLFLLDTDAYVAVMRSVSAMFVGLTAA
ncbi:hypothetical protein [Streptomyces pratensis]|uniref:hypothetical protein n=1 Tax=Streptomyces pratensis TaxID=1169025 RepID=UPI003626F1D0